MWTHWDRNKTASISQTHCEDTFGCNFFIEKSSILIQISDNKPLPELMMIHFIAAYMRHPASVSMIGYTGFTYLIHMTQYRYFPGELWGVFWEYLWDNWRRHRIVYHTRPKTSCKILRYQELNHGGRVVYVSKLGPNWFRWWHGAKPLAEPRLD